MKNSRSERILELFESLESESPELLGSPGESGQMSPDEQGTSGQKSSEVLRGIGFERREGDSFSSFQDPTRYVRRIWTDES